MSSQVHPSIVDYLGFLEQSPTSYHAVAEIQRRLDQAGFQALSESELWDLKPGGRYFVTRQGSIAAFVTPSDTPDSVRLIGAHTDSPALKLKSNAEYREQHMVMLRSEVYGGPLLNSWLNRDLIISGQVHYIDGKGNLCSGLVHLDENPVTIPQLAIHLDSKVNDEGLILNRQEHLNAIAGYSDDETPWLSEVLKQELKASDILTYDLFLVPQEAPNLMGRHGQLITGYRVDNLSSVHAGLTGLLANPEPNQNAVKMVVFWDHEEIGSATTEGAQSPFLSDTLERIALSIGLNRENFLRMKSRSLCLSVDAAHALHPNYVAKHDPNHQPLLGKGVVLKVNANQRYAGHAGLSATLHKLCQDEGVNLQTFTSRSDMRCGSTIGPINATVTGIPTVDLGIPQLSMHSARELAACSDHLDLCKLLQAALIAKSALIPA